MIQIKIGKNKKIELEKKHDQILFNGKQANYDLIKESDSSYKVYSDTKIYLVEILNQDGKKISLTINNKPIDVEVSDHIDQILEKLGMDQVQSTVVKEIKAPMPGSILNVIVEEGKSVVEGDHLLVLEAMKMENVIKSPGEGIVKKIHVAMKENVEKNHVLISFE